MQIEHSQWPQRAADKTLLLSLDWRKTALIAKSMAQNAATPRRRREGKKRGLPKVSLTALITLHFKCEDLRETHKSMLRFCSYFAAKEAEEQSAKEIAGDNNRDAEGVRRLKEIVTVKERGEREREQAPGMFECEREGCSWQAWSHEHYLCKITFNELTSCTRRPVASSPLPQ